MKIFLSLLLSLQLFAVERSLDPDKVFTPIDPKGNQGSVVTQFAIAVKGAAGTFTENLFTIDSKMLPSRDLTQTVSHLDQVTKSKVLQLFSQEPDMLNSSVESSSYLDPVKRRPQWVSALNELVYESHLKKQISNKMVSHFINSNYSDKVEHQDHLFRVQKYNVTSASKKICTALSVASLTEEMLYVAVYNCN